MTQMEQDAYMDIVVKTLGRRIEELEDFAEVTKQNYMNERKARTDEGDALRARIDEYKRITNMRNNIYILASHEGCYPSWKRMCYCILKFISSHPMRDAMTCVLPARF